jgi:hypothetical protein
MFDYYLIVCLTSSGGGGGQRGWNHFVEQGLCWWVHNSRLPSSEGFSKAKVYPEQNHSACKTMHNESDQLKQAATTNNDNLNVNTGQPWQWLKVFVSAVYPFRCRHKLYQN